MDILHSPIVLGAVAVAMVGVLLFALAQALPSLLPPAFARFIGLFLIVSALAPVWSYTEDWRLLAAIGGTALLLVVVIHLLQTRPPAAVPVEAPPDDPPADTC